VRAPSDVLAFSLLNLCNSANAAGVRSANGAVRTLVIVVLSELRELLPGIFQRRKPLHVQTLVPQSAIETLDDAFSTGLPGRMKHSWTPCSITYTSRARLQNSLPLSTVMLVGRLPRSARAFSSHARFSFRSWIDRLPAIHILA
jgi:hypothetical protein